MKKLEVIAREMFKVERAAALDVAATAFDRAEAKWRRGRASEAVAVRARPLAQGP